MAREGWDIKSAGYVLRINPKKVTQAIDPAFTKVAKLMLADPAKTFIELNAKMREVMRENTLLECDARDRLKPAEFHDRFARYGNLVVELSSNGVTK